MDGDEEVSITVEWAMSKLIRNPEMMKNAKAEIAQVVGDGRKLEENDIENLLYLRAIVKETLRFILQVHFQYHVALCTILFCILFMYLWKNGHPGLLKELWKLETPSPLYELGKS